MVQVLATSLRKYERFWLVVRGAVRYMGLIMLLKNHWDDTGNSSSTPNEVYFLATAQGYVTVQV
jgi:hypothetical protein